MFIRRDEDDIDRIFRQRLKNAEEPFPGHLWEGVRARSGRKRRIPPFWFVAAIVVSGAIGFGLYNADFTAAPIANQVTTSPVTPISKENAAAPGAQENTNKNSTVSGGSTSAEQKATPQVQPKPESIPSPISKANSKASKERFNSSERIRSSEKVNDSNFPTSRPIVVSTEITQISDGGENSSAGNKVENSQAELLVPITDGTEEGFAKDHLQNESGESASTILNTSSTSTQPDNETEDVVETTLPPAEPQSETHAEIPAQDLKLPKPPPVLGSASPFSIGIYATGYQAHRQMMSTSNDGMNYIVAPDSSHLNLSDGNAKGMAIGIGVQYALSRWVYFSAGLEYSRMKDHTHFRDIYPVGTPTYVNQMDTMWNYTDTDTTVSIGLSTVVAESIWTTSEKTAVIINSYQNYNLPLTAGLSWNHKRVFLGMEGGPVFRFGKTFTGKFRYDDKLIPAESSLSSNPYDMPHIEEGKSIYLQEVYSKWNLDWHAALRLGYSITPHFSAQGAVQYRIMKKPIHHDTLGDQRIAMPGVSLGLYYRF